MCKPQFTPEVPWSCITDVAASIKSGDIRTKPLEFAQKSAWIVGCLTAVAASLPSIRAGMDDDQQAPEVPSGLDDCQMALTEVLDENPPPPADVSVNVQQISPFVVLRLLSIFRGVLDLYLKTAAE